MAAVSLSAVAVLVQSRHRRYDLFDHFSSGSGLRNVRGLLRRSEARIMIERMQHGEVKPGEVKELLRQGKERLRQQQQS